MESQFVCRLSSVLPPSVVRPSVSQYIISELNDFFQILVVASSGLYARMFFEFLKTIFFLIFLRIFFVFVNMGPYGSENFKRLLLLQIAAESSQTFPEFSS